MADWAFQSYVVYSEAGNSINYTAGDATDSSGVLTDGAPDTTFDVGENLFVGGDNVGTYYGSYIDGDSNLYVIVATGENAGIIYSTLDADTTESQLPNNISTDEVNDTESVPTCFLTGTLIATPAGPVRVEELRVGDQISTAGGRTIQVKWLGRQTKNKALTPERHFAPVRIRAAALGNALPFTDLVLTGDHALIIDDFAINASALVNGSTITFEPLERLPSQIIFWHIETEHHDAIIANGVPAETFVDYLGRKGFDNYQEYLDLYGCERIIPEMTRIRISSQRLLPPHLRARFAQPAASAEVDQDLDMMKVA